MKQCEVRRISNATAVRVKPPTLLNKATLRYGLPLGGFNRVRRQPQFTLRTQQSEKHVNPVTSFCKDFTHLGCLSCESAAL